MNNGLEIGRDRYIGYAVESVFKLAQHTFILPLQPDDSNAVLNPGGCGASGDMCNWRQTCQRLDAKRGTSDVPAERVHSL
jgi:hypothetical protein